MVTLISYQSSGGDQGRCDEKCYGAHLPDCTCICGGMNHAKGLEVAASQTAEMAEGWVEQARARGQDVTKIELGTAALHEPLFTM